MRPWCMGTVPRNMSGGTFMTRFGKWEVYRRGPGKDAVSHAVGRKGNHGEARGTA